MDSSEMPRLSKVAERLLELLEDDNLRIARSSSGEIDSEVAQLARELEIRELYVRNELPDLGSGDLGIESQESFSNSAGERGHELSTGISTPDALDLVLEMEDDYIMVEPPSPERMPVAPCSSPVSKPDREENEVFWQHNSLFSKLCAVANVVDDDDDFEPVVLKELVNPAGLRMEVEDDGGYEPEIVKETLLEKRVSEDDGFDPEIVEEVQNVIKKGNDEVSDFVEFVQEMPKHEDKESDDDDDNYSNIWSRMPPPVYQFPSLSQALQQQPPLPFQYLPLQASMNRLPPLPFQRLPFVRLQQPPSLYFQQLPPLPLQQPIVRPWYPFNLHQERIQNYWQ